MVSIDIAGQIQGTLDKISVSFPPDIATLFVHAINTCYVPPSCPPAAAPAAPPAALPETAPAAAPAAPPTALPVLPEPPIGTVEMARVKGGKGLGAGKGERLDPYNAGS